MRVLIIAVACLVGAYAITPLATVVSAEENLTRKIGILHYPVQVRDDCTDAALELENNADWLELDVSHDEELRKKAKAYAGFKVTVKGNYKIVNYPKTGEHVVLVVKHMLPCVGE